MRHFVTALVIILIATGPVMAGERIVTGTKAQQEAQQRMRRSMDMGLRAQRKQQRAEQNRIESQMKAQAVIEREKAKTKEVIEGDKAGKGDPVPPVLEDDPYHSSDLVKQLQEDGAAQ